MGESKTRKIIALAIMLLFLVMTISSSGFNLEKQSIVTTLGDTTFYVDDDFNESTPGWNVTHFDNIQNAVDVAVDGDTVFVYNYDIVHIFADDIIISGFTIQNSGNYSGINGANTNSSKNFKIYGNIIKNNVVGISLDGQQFCEIYDNSISDNKYGIKMRGSEISIHGNIIENNEIGIFGDVYG